MERCQNETSYYDFVGWVEYFRAEDEKELEHVSKQDFYLAQIAAMVVATNSKNPKSIKIQDFLVKPESATKKNVHKLTKEERIARAKAFWAPLGYIKGMNPKKNRKEK